MLVPFKTDFEKITMGLLSYIPELKDPKHLMDELNWFKEGENRHLFLWRSEETKDLCGVIGLEEEENLILIRHIAINPSYRNEGISFEILDATADKFSDKKISGTLSTAKLLANWVKDRNKDETRFTDRILDEK